MSGGRSCYPRTLLSELPAAELQAESHEAVGSVVSKAGLRSKSLHVINAGEGVEKREPSYTVGGNAN